MRIPTDAAADEAPPPPYTAYEADQAVTPDYTPSESSETTNLPIRTNLRGDYQRQVPSQDAENVQTLFSAAYFEQRLFHYDHAGPELNLLEHNVYFDSEFTPTRLPFPHPSGAYLSRDVTGQDWATFVNCIFPFHEQNRKEKGKPEFQESRLSADQLDSPERRRKIQAIVTGWNQGFFAPRLIHITAHFEPIAQRRSPRSPASQSATNAHSRSPNHSDLQETIHHHPTAREPPLSSPCLPSPYNGGPSNSESPRILRRSDSKSSISSTSSSESSVDSIASKDLDHATVPEIHALINAFIADPHKKNHLRKSVRELRHQLRTQHLPLSSSDPYNSKASKSEKKAYKEQRKILKKDVQAAIKEAKSEYRAERKYRRAMRKSRKDARKQEWREFKHCHREEKHARRDEKRCNRDLKRRGFEPNPPLLSNQTSTPHHPATQGFPSHPQANAAYNRSTSWGSDHLATAAATAQTGLSIARARSNEAIEVARTRSTDAVNSARQRADSAREAARQRADAVRQAAQSRADAVRESVRQAGYQARDKAADAGRRGSNIIASPARGQAASDRTRETAETSKK